MTHIGILTTGGTIFCKENNNGIRENGGYAQKQKELMTAAINEYISFDIIDIFNCDSSDFSLDHIQKIIKKISSLEEKRKYDGYIITHGTDTMAYTASTLSYSLQGLQKPIIITGSMDPITVPGSDGTKNLVHSAIASSQKDIIGTYIAFGNKLLQGNKATKIHSQRYDAFSTGDYPLLGRFTMNGHLELGQQYDKYVNHISTQKKRIYEQLSQNIMVYTVSPSEITNGYLSLKALVEANPDVLVINGYGDGNVPSDKIFQSHIKQFMDHGNQVILSSQVAKGGVHHKYTGGQRLMQNGGLSSKNMTHESTRAKVARAHGNNITLKTIMGRNVSGEYLKDL